MKRFRRMHRTPAVLQKLTLRMSRDAQPPQVPRPVNVTPLKRGRGHLQEPSQSRNILLCQIDEALLLAAFRTAGLAFEARLTKYTRTMPDEKTEPIERAMGFSTRSLHAGQKPDSATGARAVGLAEDAFGVSSRYEWMFWEMCWKGETWPV